MTGELSSRTLLAEQRLKPGNQIPSVALHLFSAGSMAQGWQWGWELDEDFAYDAEKKSWGRETGGKREAKKSQFAISQDNRDAPARGAGREVPLVPGGNFGGWLGAAMVAPRQRGCGWVLLLSRITPTSPSHRRPCLGTKCS